MTMIKRQFSVEKYSVSKYAKDPRFLVLTMYICCSNKNANDSIFSDEAIQSCKDTFFNTPVVAHIQQKYGESDFAGHEMETRVDKNGDKYTYYIEQPIGMIPESGNVRIVKDKKNPRQLWIVADALLWAERNHEMTKILRRRQGCEISMEVEFKKYEVKDGIYYVDEFLALATTLLSNLTKSAFKDSVAKLTESFSQFKEAMCFALNGEEQLNNNFDSNVSHETDDENLNIVYQNEQKRGDLVNYENMIMECMSADMQEYQYMGYGEKAAYAYKDGKVYAIAYEVIDDTVKMSKESIYECSIYAKYAVETMKENEKVDGVAAKVDSENPAEEKNNQENFEEFACGNKMTEEYSKIMSEKQEASEKFEEINSKYADAETKFSEVNAKYEEMYAKFEEINSKYEESKKALSEYQNKEFIEKAFATVNEFKLKDEFKSEWTKKVNSYSDIELFEKDLVHAIYKANGNIEKVEKSGKEDVVKYGVNTSTMKSVVNKKLEPLDALREEFKINNK